MTGTLAVAALAVVLADAAKSAFTEKWAADAVGQ